LPDDFHCRTGYRQRTEFLMTDSESLFPDDSEHIFNFCLAPSWAKKTHLENDGTDPRGFAVADTGFCRGKTSVYSPNGNGKRPSTQFFGEWWNCLPLDGGESMWAGGWESYMGLSLCRWGKILQLVRFRFNGSLFFNKDKPNRDVAFLGRIFILSKVRTWSLC
jgi:hypothetical protein